ncbi:GntR family transcriptional regulator [Bacillus sp. B15-48]|uniref:GntR family transcriptional regulator n=1 Tax=Bacillus sp. B15-48 TaxID=1548601 RepID=UPI00193F8F1F|nr:GntR family transcriptional regulator [Bacillus sp. B15-48]MBM4761092.1 FCD domain-containing protein [Bacillus sp. B15-48]
MLNAKNVDKQKMGDQVLNILRTSIMLGEIPAGTHLKETVLSKEMGISRGPIREALLELENEGLVNTPPNGRRVVVGFSKKDIENLYNVRIQIEKYAISQLSVEDFLRGEGELNHCVDVMETALNHGEREVDADLQFHFLLVQLTNNKSLIQIWKSLKALIKTLIVVTTDFTMAKQIVVVEEHRKIIQHLKDGEIEKAQEQLATHLLAAREFYMSAIIQKREDEVKGD